MTFLFHLKISDSNYARTTFIVMKSSETAFVATPVQNNTSMIMEKFPSLYLFKVNGTWEYTFENNYNWLAPEMVGQILDKLEKKLEDRRKLDAV